MRITFLGGAEEVGASSLLMEIGGRRLLIDAGIRPSPKARWGLAGDQLPDLAQVDRAGGVEAILVTHAHTDHTGALELVAERYHCPVYATPITIALTRVLHADSRRIMQARLEEEGELPLFDEVAVQKLLAAFVPVPFNTRLPLASGLAATFFPAGHIAGAAMIGLESDEGRVLISGDLSVSPQRTVDGLKPPSFRPDVLILESTYGGRLHAHRGIEERRLIDAVAEVTGAGGKVLIPAFALGRAQELILILSELRRRGERLAPVWVDGMVRAICQAYTRFPEALPQALQGRGPALFFDGHTRPLERAEQRNALIWQPDPVVIISSSGMLAGGPSVEYARGLAGKPQHAILLTGYQDEESPGRRLQELAARGAGGTLRLGKERVEVQCRLGTYSLSAHADEGQLVSLVEALDPAEVLLVHGDEAARASLATALGARGRSVHLPHAGRPCEFRISRPPTARGPGRGVGAGRPLRVEALWEAVAGPAGGGYFAAGELALAWWGDEDHIDELEAALEKDDLFFVRDPHRPGVYRAHPRAQIDLSLQRREQLAALPELAGQLLILRDPEGRPVLACCVAVAADHFYVEGDPFPRWPEELLEVAGPNDSLADLAAVEFLAARLAPELLLPPDTPCPLEAILASLEGLAADDSTTGAAVALALLRAGAERTPEGYLLRSKIDQRRDAMEPNQALRFIREQFPPEARLRRCGYRLDRRVITLAFDFPQAAQGHFGEILQRLPAETGWQVEVDPEIDQRALIGLAREILGDGSIVKGPAIHRAERRVAVTVAAGARSAPGEMARARQRFREATGYELAIAVARPTGITPEGDRSLPPGAPWEINVAYAVIQEALAGSTLYRMGLAGEGIVLSFISPQVGERYRAEIEALSQKIGRELSIHPQPNQGAILEAARKWIAHTGCKPVKGSGIRMDRGVVEVRLDALPGEAARARAEAAFESQTGYRLVFSAPAAPPCVPVRTRRTEATEIAADQIRLTAAQRCIVLNPEKVDRTVERARRLGKISPPIRVQRLEEGYLLMDGLYRLQAVRLLGWDRIQAVVRG